MVDGYIALYKRLLTDREIARRIRNQLRFLSATNFGFTVLAATNVGLPASNWTVLGVTTNLGGATYQFIDSTATNYPRRFYRLRFP